MNDVEIKSWWEDNFPGLLNNESGGEKVALIEKGLVRDEFIKDPDKYVRAAVAKIREYNCYYFNDESTMVRSSLVDTEAKQVLDKLVTDESPFVRRYLAAKTKWLQHYEALENDESEYVRAVLAKKGYRLSKFVKDVSPRVRWEVANHRYGLDILINDTNEEVRKHAKLMAGEGIR